MKIYWYSIKAFINQFIVKDNNKTHYFPRCGRKYLRGEVRVWGGRKMPVTEKKDTLMQRGKLGHRNRCLYEILRLWLA